MDETASRFWTELLSRPSGPLAFRFLLQPAMAAFYAVRDGARDAKYGRPFYFWAVITDDTHRRELLHSGWQAIGKVVLIALIMDLIYQMIALRAIRPLETVVIVTALAVLPYVLLRGPVNRLLRKL